MEIFQRHKLEQAKREESILIAKKAFPTEKWINATALKFKHNDINFKLPLDIDISGIWVAQSRLTGQKDAERILIKEIKQGKILADKGAFIYLLPKLKDQDGKGLPGPDALVNGVLFEFKSITGGLDRIEIRFRQSRKQCENVYLKIDNLSISKDDAFLKIRSTLRDKKYKGGTNGDLIIYLAQTDEIYHMRIKELE